MRILFMLLAAAAVWLITSALVYGGYYIFSFLGFIQEGTFSFTEAMSIGEYIALSLILAGIVSMILNAMGVIDLNSLFSKKKA